MLPHTLRFVTTASAPHFVVHRMQSILVGVCKDITEDIVALTVILRKPIASAARYSPAGATHEEADSPTTAGSGEAS